MGFGLRETVQRGEGTTGGEKINYENHDAGCWPFGDSMSQPAVRSDWAKAG